MNDADTKRWAFKKKPSSLITPTDEGISILQSDIHPQNPEISLK
jgi:hypothetical protein